jgi:hypothetical protein
VGSMFGGPQGAAPGGDAAGAPGGPASAMPGLAQRSRGAATPGGAAGASRSAPPDLRGLLREVLGDSEGDCWHRRIVQDRSSMGRNAAAGHSREFSDAYRSGSVPDGADTLFGF